MATSAGGQRSPDDVAMTLVALGSDSSGCVKNSSFAGRGLAIFGTCEDTCFCVFEMGCSMLLLVTVCAPTPD
jgi:hypothetical protein